MSAGAFMAAGCKPAATSTSVDGYSGLDNSNYFTSANVAPGGAGSNFLAVMFTILNQTGSATRCLASRNDVITNQGLRIKSLTTNATLNCDAYNAANTLITSGSFTIAAAQLNKISVAFAMYDSTVSKLRLIVNRTEVGTGTACTGFAVNTGGFDPNVYLGTNNNQNQPCGTNVRIHGAYWGATSSGAPSLANIQTWFDSVKSANSFVSLAGVTANMVEEDYWMLTSLSNGGSIPNAGAMTLVGAASPGTTTGYNW